MPAPETDITELLPDVEGSDQRFDVVFTGQCAAGQDLARVRAGIQRLFRLDDRAVDRLFQAGRVTVKRGVDLATARRFEAAFRETGAVVELQPHGGPDLAATPPAPGPAPSPEPARGQPAASAPSDADAEEVIVATVAAAPPSPAGPRSPAAGVTPPGYHGRATAGPAPGPLELAPPGALLEELDDRTPVPMPDISHLHLVPGGDWSLEDCAEPPPPVSVPTTDHLALEPLTPAGPTEP